MKDPEFSRMIHYESLILEITEKICELMKIEHQNYYSMAKMLGITIEEFQNILEGNIDLKMTSLIFHKLGYNIVIQTNRENGE